MTEVENRDENGKQTVIFDTNALMIPKQFGVDVFDEVERLVGSYDAVVPEAVVDELEGLKESADGDAAEMALGFVEKNCRVLDVGSSGYKDADDVIARMAEEEGSDAKVVTNDTELKSRLLEFNVPVLYLRQKSYLDITYP